MRKGFNGLHGLVRDRLELEPTSGHLFLFCNGSRNRLKVLFWDGSGLWICEIQGTLEKSSKQRARAGDWAALTESRALCQLIAKKYVKQLRSIVSPKRRS